MLVKFAAPTKFDLAPYLSLWQKRNDDGSVKYFVQTSQDDTKPLWEEVGMLLEEACEYYLLNDDCFMEDMIKQRELHRARKQAEEAAAQEN